MLVLTMDTLVRTGLTAHSTHMMSIGAVRLFFRRLALRHQLHPALRTFAGFVGDDFGVHNAGVFWRWRGRWRSTRRRILRTGAVDRVDHRDHSQEEDSGFQT